jgi:hypothetical protein
LHNKIVYAGADDNNFRNKMKKRNEWKREMERKVLVNKQLNSDFPFPTTKQKSKLNPVSFSFKCSSHHQSSHKAVNVNSRFHLIAVQIALPFIKRTIKSSFAICDTLSLSLADEYTSREKALRFWGVG